LTGAPQVEEMMSERAEDTAATPAEAAATGAKAAEQPTLEQQLAIEQARVAEYHESLLRERADFINYKRRVESERAELIPMANAALLTKLLPIVDDFDLALANVPAEARESKWVEGIMLIQRKLLKLLEGEGVTPIAALGQPFDPNLHEAVIMDEGAGEPHVVVAELRKGYKLRDRVLRPTMVRVGSAAT
jgi:molecular chaperone GrpE